MTSLTVASRRLLGTLLATLFLASLATAAPVADPANDPDGLVVAGDVGRAIAARNCSLAVDSLKNGLKKNSPSVSLLAGSMYEHGMCVKQDWSASFGFYTLAFEGGLKEAAERLAAGYADPANGPDIAAALWWGRHGRSFQLPGCTVTREAADDPDRFVAELATWSQAHLAGCNYIIGVMSMITAELKYPTRGIDQRLGGEFTLRFLPGQARVEVKRGETREYVLLGWIDDDALGERRKNQVTNIFEKALGDIANRALARYPQPAGIPAETQIEVKYNFGMN